MSLSFEHDDDGGDDGPGRELRLGPGRRIWPAVAVVAIAAVVVASVALGGRGDDRGATPTTVPVTSPATSAAPATTAPTTIPGPTTSTTIAAPLPFGRATGLVVYLTPGGSASGPFTLLAYDVDAGVLHELDLGQDVGWYIRALDAAGGTVVDGGAVVVVPDGQRARPLDVSGVNGIADGPNGRTAPGPDGGLWIRGFNPPGVALFDAAGAATGRRYDLAAGAELYGSMADGRPVVRGADRVAYAIEADGARTQLDGVPSAPVVRGRYVEIRCDAAQACDAWGHLDTDGVLRLGPTHDAAGDRADLPQPDGPYVAEQAGDDLSILDTRTGEVRAAAAGLMGFYAGADDRVNARFLPDGLGLVVQTQRGLAFVGLDGHPITDLLTGGAAIPDAQLLGVGKARAWEGG